MAFKLPDWLRRDTVSLPPWAKLSAAHSPKVCALITADTDGYIRDWLALLGVHQRDVDQYWLEVAYQCAKLDLQSALVGTQYDPRTAGKAAEFHFSKAPQWALSKFPDNHARTELRDGKRVRVTGIEIASKGKEARQHYTRIRGQLPF